MRSNTAYSEERNIYKNYKLIEGRKAESKKYMIIQKLLGIGCLCLAVAELVAGYKGLIDEGGLFLIALPLGLFLIFTKEKVMMF